MFYSDRLGKRISYSIRFFLEQEATRLWGVCEAMSVESSPGNQYGEETQVLKCRYPVTGEVSTLLEKNSPVSLHSNMSSLSTAATNFCENISSFLFTYDVVDDSIAQLSGEWTGASRPAIGMAGTGREIWIKKTSGKTPGFIEEFFPRAGSRIKELKGGDATIKSKSDKEKKDFRIKLPSLKKKKDKDEDIVTAAEKDSSVIAQKDPANNAETIPRVQDVQETIVSDSAFIRVDLYDNGLVDGDIVSLYLNGEKVVDKKKITAKAIHLELPLNPGGENVIRLFAENTGEIPPNTALLVVRAGNTVHHVNLSASLLRDALLVIKVPGISR